MSSSNVENFAPNVIRRVAKEISELVSNSPEGIKIIANEQDISDIQAIIEGPGGTPYQNGSFRIKLLLGKCFPSAPPKGFFMTKIFHPNVSRTGEICVNTLKKDWNENLGIKHILLVIKCLLIVPNPESALNEEAGKLLLENYEEYFKRARMVTEIHAKKKHFIEKVEDEYEENNSDYDIHINGSTSTKKYNSENDNLKPLSKKQANNQNNINKMNLQSSNKTSTTNRDNKKRILKRL